MAGASYPPGFLERMTDSIREYVNVGVSPVEKGRRFLEWCLVNVFELSEHDVDESIIDAPGDLGIDAYYPQDESAQELIVVQSKYGSSHSVDAISRFSRDVENLKEQDPKSVGRIELVMLINKLRDKQTTVRTIYITDQAVSEEFEGVEVYDIRKIVNEIWERIKTPAAGKKGVLKFESHVVHGNFVLGVISLNELAKFLTETKDFVFESNIRQFLKFRTKVNKGIRNTLENNPEKFFYYNNGVTMVATEFSVDSGVLELSQPQIVNGAQTCNAILDEWERSGRNITGSVTITAIREAQISEMDRITRFRNSQNAVRGKDLIALTDFHKSIQKQLEMLDFFYEIQAGSFDSLSKQQKHNYRGHNIYNQYLPGGHTGKITSKDAIQSFVAGIKQNPTGAYSHLSEFMPNGTKYEEVFTDALTSDYRLLFYPYLVKEYAKSYLGYGKGGEERKRNATLFFVALYFYILISKMLEHDGDYLVVDLGKIEKIFAESPLNREILQFTDAICSGFVTDSKVFEEQNRVIGWANFFKQHAYRDEFKRVIDQKIMDVEGQRLAELKKRLTSFVGGGV